LYILEELAVLLHGAPFIVRFHHGNVVQLP
jgi:hypothetical protein